MTILEHLNKKDQHILFSCCCVCKKFYGLKPGHGVSGISHGYCDPCLEVLIAQVNKKEE